MAKSYSSAISITTVSSSSSSPLPSPSSSTVSSVAGSLSTSSPSSCTMKASFAKLVPVKAASIVKVRFTVSVAPAGRLAISNPSITASVTLAFEEASLIT